LPLPLSKRRYWRPGDERLAEATNGQLEARPFQSQPAEPRN